MPKPLHYAIGTYLKVLKKIFNYNFQLLCYNILTLMGVFNERFFQNIVANHFSYWN